MNRILVVTLVCSAVFYCAGCKKFSLGRKKAEPEPLETAEQQQIRELKAVNTTLKDKLAVRDSQVKELRERADTLAQKVRKLEFINERQEKQIDVLAQAPLARDEYKDLCEELKKSLERVTTRLATLEATNKLLVVRLKMAARHDESTTRPSTTSPATTEPTISPVTPLPALDED